MKYKKSLLIDAFESFYLILLEMKAQIDSDTFFSTNDIQEEKDNKIAIYQNRLYQFIKEKDAMIAYENGKIASDAFAEVIYIMVAVADEIFLSIDWEGKVYWRRHLLEQKFFDTSCAGEKLLLNLDQFLRERNVQDSEIGMIYLYALACGFKGKLRYEENVDLYLNALKEQIFYTIFQQSPKLYQNGTLFNQAIENIFVKNNDIVDNRMRLLKKLGLIFLGVYLAISHIIWYMNIYSTSHMLKEIELKHTSYMLNSKPSKANIYKNIKDQI